MDKNVFFFIDKIVDELRDLMPDAQVWSRMIRRKGKRAVMFDVLLDGKKFGNSYPLDIIDFKACRTIPKSYYDRIMKELI